MFKVEDKVKFLGVIFDRRITWKTHIDHIEDKCKKAVNLLRSVSGEMGC